MSDGLIEQFWGCKTESVEQLVRRAGKSPYFDFSYQNIQAITGEHLVTWDMFDAGVHNHVRKSGYLDEGGGCKKCKKTSERFISPILMTMLYEYLDFDYDGYTFAISDNHLVFGDQYVCWEQIEPFVFLSKTGLVFDLNVRADSYGHYLVPGNSVYEKMLTVEKYIFEKCYEDELDASGRVYIGKSVGLFMGMYLGQYVLDYPHTKLARLVRLGVVTYEHRESSLPTDMEQELMELFRQLIENTDNSSLFTYDNLLHVTTAYATSEADVVQSTEVLGLMTEISVIDPFQRRDIVTCSGVLGNNSFKSQVGNLDRIMNFRTDAVGFGLLGLEGVDINDCLSVDLIRMYKYHLHNRIKECGVSEKIDAFAIDIPPLMYEKLLYIRRNASHVYDYLKVVGRQALEYICKKLMFKIGNPAISSLKLSDFRVEIVNFWEGMLQPLYGGAESLRVSVYVLIGLLFVLCGEKSVRLILFTSCPVLLKECSTRGVGLFHSRNLVPTLGYRDDRLVAIGKAGFKLFMLLDTNFHDMSNFVKQWRHVDKQLDAMVAHSVGLRNYGVARNNEPYGVLGWFFVFWHGEVACIVEQLDICRPLFRCTNCHDVDHGELMLGMNEYWSDL